jgi:hypothetical protein
MANAFYNKGIEKYLEGSIASLTDTIKVLLATTAYTPALTTDEFHSIIPGGSITAAGVALTGKTGAAGTLSASNLVFTAVSGSQSAYLAIYKDTGVSGTSPLIGLIDTATGLPVTPNGGDITVAWSSGQVFTLCEGLKERDRKMIQRLCDWLRGVCGIPAEQGPSGLWLPTPELVPGALR